MNTEQIDRAAEAAAITIIAIDSAHNHSKANGKPEPTPEEVLTGLDRITAWFEDGPASEERVNRAVDMVEILLESPDELTAELIQARSEDNPSPIRLQAERHIASGKVTTETTFADLPAILKTDAQSGSN